MHDSARVWTRGDVLAGTYRLDELVGSGGFGQVFRATHVTAGSAVAIKLLRPPWDGERRARFEREARVARRIDHPNVVRVVDLGDASDGAPFIAFEWLDGTSLASLLAARGALPEGLAAHVTASLLSALDAIHAEGIVHRDVKPSNVMLCGAEPHTVKLLDLGVAKPAPTETSPQLSAEGLMIGTVAYMAPEQIDARPAEPASDLYGVGLILAEMLSGKPVYDGPAIRICAQKLRVASRPFGDVQRRSRLWPIIDAATRQRPDERPANAAAMRVLLAACLPDAAPSAHTAPPPPLASRRRRAIWFGAVGLACCSASLAAYLLSDPARAPRAGASASSVAVEAVPPRPLPCSGLDAVSDAIIRAAFFPPPAEPTSGKEDVLDFVSHWYVGGPTQVTLYEFPEPDRRAGGVSREELMAKFADHARTVGRRSLLGKTKLLTVKAAPEIVAAFERAHCR